MRFLRNTVVNFHDVYDGEWLEDTLLFLKNRYSIVSLDDIHGFYYSDSPLRCSCHITFDDGHISFFDTVFPLLQKHGIEVSLFVSPFSATAKRNFWFQEVRGYDEATLTELIVELTGNRQYLSYPSCSVMLKTLNIETIWEIITEYQSLTNTKPKPFLNIGLEHIQELKDSGLVRIGAHTQSHPILRNESDDVALLEIKESIEQLSDILNMHVESFAFPNGIPGFDFGERELSYLHHCGIKLSFTTELRPFKRSDNPLCIPRNGLASGNSTFVFAKLLLGSKWPLLKRILGKKIEDDYRAKTKTYNLEGYSRRT